MDGWTDGRTDGGTDGRKDGRTDDFQVAVFQFVIFDSSISNFRTYERTSVRAFERSRIRIWILNFGFWISDLGIRISDSDFVFRTSDDKDAWVRGIFAFQDDMV